MYLSYFKFKSKPFAMNPDPAFLYSSEQHSAALTMLEYAIESQAPFCLLTGEIGSGKTTLIRYLIRMLSDKVREATAGSWACSAERAKTELGFHVAASLEARLRNVGEAYLHQ